MTTPFVIAATQRSGTQFLETVLNSHPHIFCHAEVLDNKRYGEQGNFYRFWLERVREDESQITWKCMIMNFDRFLSEIFSLPDKKAVGIDIKYNHFSYIPNILPMLNAHRVRVIHLVRRNVLKTYISGLLNLNKRKLGRNSHGTGKVPAVKVVLEPNGSLLRELNRRMKEIHSFRQLLSKSLTYLELAYEELLDPMNGDSGTIVPSALETIYNFLGIEDARYALGTELKKTNPTSLPELIENYHEVASFLTDSGMAHLLDLYKAHEREHENPVRAQETGGPIQG